MCGGWVVKLKLMVIEVLKLDSGVDRPGLSVCVWWVNSSRIHYSRCTNLLTLKLMLDLLALIITQVFFY